MKFRIRAGAQRVGGRLCYVPSEYSILTIDGQQGAIASALINDLQIELSPSGRAVSLRGLMPHTLWNAGTVCPPPSATGALETADLLTPGVAHRLNKSGRAWPVIFDQVSGWIFLGSEYKKPVETVEFLLNCIAAVAESELVGLWLLPERLSA